MPYEFMLIGAVLTIFTGSIVFLVGQFTLALVLNPMQEFRKAIGEASYILLRHQAKLNNPFSDDDKKIDKGKDASIRKDIADELKSISAKLLSTSNAICGYSLPLERLFGLPVKSDICEAARELNGLSQSMNPEDFCTLGLYTADKNWASMVRIGEILKIQTTYSK